MSSAFSDFTRAASVEAQALPPAAGAGRPLLALTRGLAAAAPATSASMLLPGTNGGSNGGAAAALTLPDGRLRVGTHLARRYRYLSTLGEGVSAQVILAEDTLAPSAGQLVAIKAMSRQHPLAGQREARALRFLHAAAPGGAALGLARLLDTCQLGEHFCLVTEEGCDVEGDALQGSDSMFYFKAAPGPSPSPRPGPSQGGGRGAGSGVPAGEGEKEQDQGTVWGALASRDEQHGSFRRAMEEAAAEASSRRYANDLKQAAGGRQHLPAEVTEPPRALPPAATTGKEEAPAAADVDAGDGQCQHPYQGGILSSLRRRQGERQEAERSLERLVERLHPKRGPGDPGPPPAARVIETAMGRSAALGLCAAFVSEVLTQQSVLSQLLGRFEGSYQIELAAPAPAGRSSSQAAALGVLAVAVLLTLAERAAGGGTVPHWRPLGLAPSAQVWLGRAAMLLFALLLAFETVHSNRPAFGTLFYLWP